MPIYVIFSDPTDDGYIDSSDTNLGGGYAGARAGTGTKTADSASTTIQVGQSFDLGAGLFHIWEGFLGFDTSVVANPATRVDLALYTNGIVNVGLMTLVEARLQDFGASVTAADWVAGATLSGLSRLASYATPGVNAAYNTWTSDAPFPGAINLSGYTRFLLCSARTTSGTAPANTGNNNEYIVFASGDAAGTSQDPKITVYAPLAASNASATITADDSAASATATGVIPADPLPLELRVYDGGDLMGPPVAILSSARNIKWRDVHNDLGSGSLELSVSDASISALAQYALVRCFDGPFEDFAFWVETLSYVVASPQGDIGNKVTVAGRGLEAYLERALATFNLGGLTYTARSAGYILADLIDRARTRSAPDLLPALTYDFSADLDSAGNAWSGTLASLTLTFTEQPTILDVLTQLRELGVYARMRKDFVLQMWTADPGRDVTSSVVLRQGKHLADAVTWSVPYTHLASVMWAQGNGMAVIAAVTGTGLPERVEGYVALSGSDDNDTLNQLLDSEGAKRKQAATAITVPVIHGLGSGEYEHYRHYAPGAFVALDVPGWFDRVSEQVAAIEVESADGTLPKVSLDLSAVRPVPLVSMAKRIAALERAR